MTIRYEAVGGGVLLTLDRPERMNAVSEDLIEALDAGIDRAVADGARAVMLTGAGRAFCAGGTIAHPLPEDAGAILETHLNPLLIKLAEAPLPVITAVNGPAIGAGLALALAGDVIIAGQSASFGAAFVRVGLVPDGGLSWLLPRSIGYHRAMAMMVTGDVLTADAAREAGIVTRVVEDDALPAESLALLERIAAGPTAAIASLRQTVRQALDTDFAHILHAERQAQRVAGNSADFLEGANAWIEKRKARFTGS